MDIPHGNSRRVAAIGLALAAVYVVWGSTYLGIRIALEGFPPFLMAGVRSLVAGALLYGFLRLRGAPRPSALQWRSAALVGGLLLLGGNGGVVWAEQTVSSGMAAVVVSTVTLWAALFAGIWGEWPHRVEWLGMLLGFTGVVLLNFGGNLKGSPAGAVALGIATVSWALGSMWSRKLALPGGMMAAAAEMLAGGALLLVASAVAGESAPPSPSFRAVLALLYLIVFGSLIGFTAYIYLLGAVRPAVATSYAYVNPVIALLLGMWLAGERVSAHEWLAMPIVLAGVALVALARGRRASR
ncbi:MAG: drug/metabolite exporter YedA [Acidobacteriota bacterium]